MLEIVLLSTGVYCVAIFLLGSLMGRCIAAGEREGDETPRAIASSHSFEFALPGRHVNFWLDERQPTPSTQDLIALAAVNAETSRVRQITEEPVAH
jgi:hypothetical protein